MSGKRVSDSEILYFGRRLEPRGARVLHGAGQDHRTFLTYTQKVTPYRPVVYMAYAGPNERGVAKLEELRGTLESLGDHYVVPQIGAGLPADKILRGENEELDHAYLDRLEALQRPVFLRLGFEFNGHWNGYRPDTYRRAFRRFVEKVRARDLEHVALVWCYVPDGNDKNYMAYYPGDDYVDWWAFDPFSPKDITDGLTRGFLDEAGRRRFPVMIAESSPRWVGARQGELSWRVWFQRYFNVMTDSPQIKAFCYIAWNWAEQVPRDESSFSWHWWGDARLWLDDYVFGRWRQELALPRYVHAAPPAASRALLGCYPKFVSCQTKNSIIP